ncbi:MAG: beta/gamma crystallin-related protein [Nostoc sp.]|uniref:beta/gamma crystallin-related protein n=1 Tax=Nostoc sp. TaxID=1180 RepID=UPI002FFCD28D
MLSTKENLKQLDATLAVKELDNETAAAIQGGYALEVFDDYNYTDRIGSFNVRSPQVKANDRISSIQVNAGTWRFYVDADYKGTYFEVGPGRYSLFNYPLDNKISSLKRV